jgi:hypothetical protein
LETNLSFKNGSWSDGTPWGLRKLTVLVNAQHLDATLVTAQRIRIRVPNNINPVNPNYLIGTVGNNAQMVIRGTSAGSNDVVSITLSTPIEPWKIRLTSTPGGRRR